MKPLYLVDASIYIFRAWFSLPEAWFAPNGYPVNALYGYIQFWFKFLHDARPESVVAAYDESLGTCFRNDLYPDYKMSRALPDAALAFQLEACRQFTAMMGIASPASERYEADDIIATLAGAARRRRQPVVVVSRDKDLGQLLTARDQLWDFADNRRLSAADIQRQFGVRPDQLADYLALVGDSIDDIPGVPGVGPKTAAALLQAHDSVDGIYRNLRAVERSALRGSVALAAKLDRHRGQVRLSRRLARLHARVPLPGVGRALRWQPPPRAEVRAWLEAFGLGGRFDRQLQRAHWWNTA